MVDGLKSMLGALHGPGKTLVLVDVAVARAFCEHLSHIHQGLRIIRITLQQFLAHLEEFVIVIRGLVGAHDRPVEQRRQVAVGKLRREIVRRLFHGRRVGERTSSRIGVQFRLALCLG